jgi:hypothetical protein
MLYTLSQARSKVKRFVDGGSCRDSVIDEAINDALERLVELENWDCLTVMTRISTCDSCFPLPYNASAIISCDINGAPAKVFGRGYQFLHAGPGDLDMRCSSSGLQDLVDMSDHWATMFDIPHCYENTVDSVTEEVEVTDGMTLVAFCTDAADEGKSMTVHGYLPNNEIVRTGVSEGEVLTINRWENGVEGVAPAALNENIWTSLGATANAYASVSRVVKPDTAGYVSLYAVDEATNRMFFLAKYHPRQTIPQFHRYRITNDAGNACPSNVLALLKLRYVPVVEDTDILPVDGLQALKLMVMAISEENKLNIAGAQQLIASASAVLSKKEESKSLSTGMPVILDSDYRTSLGSVMNRRMIL